ncbi:hypothetical protein JCM10450v2_007281 [Rhodotorula kratochvilovae]
MTAASLPPLLRLSPELLDRILVLAVPTKPLPARLALARLLRVCRTLAPFVRRHLYAKLSLVVAAPSGQDRKLVRLLRETTAGPLVRFLKVRAPDPAPALTLDGDDDDDDDEDPLAALVPRPRMPQPETIAWVADALERMPRVRYLALELRVAAWLEGDVLPAGDFGPDPAPRERLQRALEAWGDSLETLLVALEDAQQRLQVWAAPGLGHAPYVAALCAWERLTTLDLWRVKLVLTSHAAQDDAALPPPPTFRLRTLVLTQCEFGGAPELRWLLGGPASTRSAALTHLTLREVEFAHHPRSSAPLLGLFPDPSSAAYTPPAFASSLTDLALLLAHPIGTPTPPGLLSPLSALESVTLGGPAVDLPLLSSLFSSRSGAASLRALTLQYLPLVPLASLLSLLSAPAAIPALTKLQLHEAWTHPRVMSFADRRATREPGWDELEGDEAWEAVEKALRGVWRARRREGRRDEVRLWRNRGEREYLLPEAEGDESPSEEGDESPSEEGDAPSDSDDAGARSSPDPNALWVPPASDDDAEEGEREWLARRRREAEEEEGEAWDSDF